MTKICVSRRGPSGMDSPRRLPPGVTGGVCHNSYLLVNRPSIMLCPPQGGGREAPREGGAPVLRSPGWCSIIGINKQCRRERPPSGEGPVYAGLDAAFHYKATWRFDSASGHDRRHGGDGHLYTTFMEIFFSRQFGLPPPARVGNAIFLAAKLFF